MKYQKEELLNKIKNADKILVGIGREFQTEDNQKTREAYTTLQKLVDEKDFFIVSLCTDDFIYKSELNQERIVAPCGSLHRYQCENDCNHKLFTAEEYAAASCCPDCGKMLVPNTVDVMSYNESAYLPQWEHYTKWLQNTLNKNFVILELGVGMQFPGVLRFPVEKIVLYNQKAVLYRVNNTISQIPVEIADRACEIHQNAVEFITNEIVY